MSITYPERLPLAQAPTPIQFLPRLSEAFGGPEIYIKRDDLTGVELSGNKVRKLEFLLADAQKCGADVLITCGGVQSNHARAVAMAAAKLGWRSHLLLRRDGASLRGNLFLDRLVDAEITFLTPQEFEDIDARMAQEAEKYAKMGQRAYVIPLGGSNVLGTWGYVAAMEEIAGQIAQLERTIDCIVCAVGSGGTYAGLMIGKYLQGFGGEIWGINVSDDASHFQKIVRKLVQRWQKSYQPLSGFKTEDIQIIDGYVGKGYALSRQEEIEVIKQVARLEGIILDPVYTGKAMYGLQDLIQKGRLAREQRVLFLHTGGIFGLFPKGNLFF